MYKNILLPLDGSKIADEVIPAAISLAKSFDAIITLIQVVEVIPVLKEARELESKFLREQAGEYLNRIKGRIEKEGIPAQVAILTGKPEVEILNYAERLDVDLILISTHGLGDLGRWALGSVSDKVVRHSPKPVLLLRSFSRDLLRGKVILAVDDEPDILETLEEQLDMSIIHKAENYDAAVECLEKNKYDLAILDIMGVRGFDLLKETVARNIPTVILTAHALAPEALEKSIKGGAVCFLPKDNMTEIEEFLVDVLRSRGKPIWSKIMWRFGPFFRKRFGWGEKDEKEFIENLKEIVFDKEA